MNTIKDNQRTCTECQNVYTHEPLMFGDRDMMAGVTICSDCTEKAEQDAAMKAREAKAIAAWEETVPAEYRKTDIKHPDYVKQMSAHSLCLRWLKGQGIGDERQRLFLGLIGESGLCKTRIISQMVKRLIWRGDRVTWVNSAQFQWSCQKQFIDEHSAKASKYLGIYRRSQILVFDDIGSLKGTEIVSDTLYDLLEYRTTRELPTLWTSNESIGEMLPGNKITEFARKRSISRLAGYSNILEL